MAQPGQARVLWLTEEAPDRSLGGGNIRQAHLFSALAGSIATDLVVTAAVTDEQVRASAATVTELAPRPQDASTHPIGRRARELGVLLGSRHPSAVHPAAGHRRALSAAIRGRRYELICVEHEALAPLAGELGSGRRLITYHHLLSAMIAEELKLAPGRRQRWFRRRDLAKAQRLECWSLEAYDQCVVCSAQDRVRLEALAEAGTRRPVAVIPNGVDLTGFRPSDPPATQTVLLPGTLAWPPNVDAARWLCTEIWPRVRAAVPDAELVLAGRAPGPEVRALAQIDGVRVHGDVPSMTAYFEAARAVAVPVRVGTGTRIKALEALASGRPVIGTSIGLEGLGIENGVHARIADDPQPFASGLIEVLRDDALAGSLARAGRGLVEAGFGWDRIGARFVALVESLLEAPGGDQPLRSSSSSA